MFGFQRRRVFTCECETLLPKLGPLPQMSHVDAIAVLLESYKANRPERSAGGKGIKREPFRANPQCWSASPLIFTREFSSVRRATANSHIFADSQAEDRDIAETSTSVGEK